MEGQARLQDLGRQHSNCKAQIFQRDRDSKMATLTVMELGKLHGLDSAAVVYKAIGKM